MRKIYLFAAALAAIATVSSCTSDDEIVQAPEPTPEPDAVVVNQSPFTFNVSVNEGTFNDGKTTRATALTGNALSTAFTGFSMFAIEELKTSPTSEAVSKYKTYVGESDFSGAFSYEDDVWKYTGATWPDPNDNTINPGYYPGKSYFYAVSFAGKAGNATGINSANLKLSNTATTLVNDNDVNSENKGFNPITSPDDIAFYYEMDIDQNDDSKIDLSKQEDVLVASYTTGATSGEIPLEFSHAFANVEVKYILPAQNDNWGLNDQTNEYNFVDWQPSTKINGPGHFMYVDYIAIHGLKRAGIYNFKTGWAAVDDTEVLVKKNLEGDARIITPTFYQDKIEDMTPYTYGDPDKKLRDKKREFYTDLFVGESSLMIIPQSVTKLEWEGNLGDEITNTKSGYIEVHGYPVLNYDNYAGRTYTSQMIDNIKSDLFDELGEWKFAGQGVYLSDPNGIGGTLYSVYIPFSITFEANQKYVLWVDLSNLKENNGDMMFIPE